MADYETPDDVVPREPGTGGRDGGNGNGGGPRTIISSPEDEPAGRHYHYVAEEILVVEEDVILIEGTLRARRMEQIDVFRPTTATKTGTAVVRFRLPPPTPEDITAGFGDVVSTVTALRTPVPDPREASAADREGIHEAQPSRVPRVFPNHAMSLSIHGRPHGALNRRRAEELDSPPRRRFLPLPGHSVKIGVIDTGMWRGRLNWYNNRVDLRPDDEETVGPDLSQDAGHGTFITGVIHAIAPGAKVKVRRFGDQEWVSDRDLAEQILALAREGVHIINLSLGGTAHDNIPPVCTQEAIGLLRQDNPGLVVVASAGNLGASIPEYPCALKGVVGVGALGSDEQRAAFSNFGPWVDACAPGVDVHSTFVDWRPPPSAAGPSFDGYALWSGTSFSAPAVAAAIAVHRSPGGWRQFLWFLRPRNARLAADALLNDPGNTRLPGLGAVVKPVSYARRRP